MLRAINRSTIMKITTVVPFPARAAELQVPRRVETASQPLDAAELAANAAALEAERRRLEEDADALRLREANLREYEAHLRTLQSEMDAARGTAQSQSTAPFPTRSLPPFAHDDASLEAAWQKLHRARELSEAEQAHLRDDRLAMHAFEAELKQREATVAAREARVTAQEEVLAAAPRTKREPMAAQQTISAFTRLTRAPFLIAESLRGKSSKEDAKPTE
jgi:hypothetical protein